MINLSKIKIITFLTSTSLSLILSTPVLAQPTVPAPGLIQIQQLVTRLINISVTVAFMSLTVWLIWGALKFFITSGGDPKALAHAWASVTWAFMGIFFMILAWLTLRLIAEVSGVDVTQFCLGFPPYCVDGITSTFNTFKPGEGQ